MAHTAALGCCGLADKDANVLMMPVDNKKNVCKYKIFLSVVKERDYTEYIGIDPNKNCSFEFCLDLVEDSLM